MATETMLLHSGYIHSHSAPFAQAMAVRDGVISWLGDQDAIATAAPEAQSSYDLEGCVVTPGFVDLGLFQSGLGQLDSVASLEQLQHWAQGSAGLAGALVQARGDALERLLVGDHDAYSVVRGLLIAPDTPLTDIASLTQRGLIVFLDFREAGGFPGLDLVAAVSHLPVRYLLGGDKSAVKAAEITAWIELIAKQLSGLERLRVQNRICWLGELPEGVDLMAVAAWKVIATATQPVKCLLDSGIIVALGSAGVGSNSSNERVNYWGLIHDAVLGAGEWSGRGAMRAFSRAGWRLLGQESTGDLEIGSPAIYNIWEHEGFGVIAPRGQLASWNQEAQAGIPVLPDVTQGLSHIRLRNQPDQQLRRPAL